MTPVTEPIMPTMVLMRRLLNFSPSSALLFSANSLNISFSALKLLTTEKPARQSLRAAVKLLLRSDTLRSAASILLPVNSDAIRGSIVTPAAIAVSSGEYHSIMTSAPAKVNTFDIRAICCSR